MLEFGMIGVWHYAIPSLLHYLVKTGMRTNIGALNDARKRKRGGGGNRQTLRTSRVESLPHQTAASARYVHREGRKEGGKDEGNE